MTGGRIRRVRPYLDEEPFLMTYGDGLGDVDLGALVRLEVSRDLGRMDHHAAEAELLSGGLYLSLGLHEEATRIFDRQAEIKAAVVKGAEALSRILEYTGPYPP